MGGHAIQAPLNPRAAELKALRAFGRPAACMVCVCVHVIGRGLIGTKKKTMGQHITPWRPP